MLGRRLAWLWLVAACGSAGSDAGASAGHAAVIESSGSGATGVAAGSGNVAGASDTTASGGRAGVAAAGAVAPTAGRGSMAGAGRGAAGRGAAGAMARAGSGGVGAVSGAGGMSGSGSAGRGGATAGLGSAAQCSTMTGAVTYTLAKAAMPTAAQQSAYDKISAAMDIAVSYYNCYTNITKHDMVSYDPAVATADGSTNGSIRFGSTDSINYITAMHEISHSVGIGGAQFGPLVVSGIFTGKNATAELVSITGNPQDTVHGDKQHFWPYGLNYTSEVKSTDDLIDHCKLVVAIRKDMGL
jgi:hypothetical protein